MTQAQILKQLDLLPFAEFVGSKERLAWIKQSDNPRVYTIQRRRSGRTTEIICDMLSYLSQNPANTAYVAGHTPRYSKQLLNLARSYAVRLGIDPLRVVPKHTDPKTMVFTDHYDKLTSW